VWEISIASDRNSRAITEYFFLRPHTKITVKEAWIVYN
jgi:hypothetical protein